MSEKKHVWLEDELDAAETPEEMQRILKEYHEQKMAEAARKEEERINAPSLFDKFMKGVRVLKDKMQKKRKNIRVQDTQKTR